MVFTVLQYLPLLEEESAAHSVELAKKDKADDTPDDDDSSNDDDKGDEKTDLYDHHSFSYLTSLASEHRFYTRQHAYPYPIVSIQTPPPKA